jgi:L-threonylcarbamoyladenylate synthase
MIQEIIVAGNLIKQGKVVAMPTETVYGLAANAFDEQACQKIFKLKGRPGNNPLIVHVANLSQAQKLALFNDDALTLATLWPGPITLVLPQKPGNGLAKCVTAGLDTVAIRIPAHELAIELIVEAGVPLAAPSANKSGRLSPTNIEHVLNDFADEGIHALRTNLNCRYGLESTVVDLSGNFPTILRFGFITPELIEATLGKKVKIAGKDSAIKSPGMMYKHYAPATPIYLNAQAIDINEVGLNFGTNLLRNPHEGYHLNLSPSADLAEAASNLFAYLHALDDYAKANQKDKIAIARIPNIGIGLAINDRLKRGAEPKVRVATQVQHDGMWRG